MSALNSSIKKDICNSGFRPELFTVDAGSYASNQVYGSGLAAVNDYNTETIRKSSIANIRQHDSDVDFSIKVVLDLSLSAPGFITGEEIRIRTLQPLASGEPGAYSRKLPVKSINYGQPLFLDVEIIDPSTGAPFAGFPSAAGIGQLQARLLINGELALVVADLSAGPPPVVTPLTSTDLAPLFGAAAGTKLLISVRGSYRS